MRKSKPFSRKANREIREKHLREWKRSGLSQAEEIWASIRELFPQYLNKPGRNRKPVDAPSENAE